jgi:hypothetical protein
MARRYGAIVSSVARPLDLGAEHVTYEWVCHAQVVAEWARGWRPAEVMSVQQLALLESFLIHDRCLINFLCGNVKGGRHRNDIQPRDFLGVDWSPPSPVDEELRGRLTAINAHLAHLSWERTTLVDQGNLRWYVVHLAHPTSNAMRAFVQELESSAGTCVDRFQIVLDRVQAILPPRGRFRIPPVAPPADPRIPKGSA